MKLSLTRILRSQNDNAVCKWNSRFITGKIGQIDKQNINISTPTAQIATEQTLMLPLMNWQVIGDTLPDAKDSSGEIVVATAMGR